MNQKQYKKAVRILAKGCKANGWLATSTGEHCAIGELLHAAGVPDKDIVHHGSPTSKQNAILLKVYGLDYPQVDDIMDRNDDEEQLCQRRKAVIGYLKDCVSETGSAE